MALSIPAVNRFDLADHGVSVTREVPTGLFSIGLPDIDWSHCGTLLTGALALTFVGYSESLAAARSMAVKHGYDIDPNQELIAQGMSCGTAGLVSGFSVNGSLPKTSVADSAGQESQMPSLLNAVLVVMTLLFLASIFQNLPSATLGAWSKPHAKSSPPQVRRHPVGRPIRGGLDATRTRWRAVAPRARRCTRARVLIPQGATATPQSPLIAWPSSWTRTKAAQASQSSPRPSVPPWWS
jgi:hypothetical protein